MAKMLSLHYSPIPPQLTQVFCESGFEHSSELSPNTMLGSCLARASRRTPSEIEKEKNDQILLADGLEAELLPRHVGVIMDGNRRWAKNKGLPVQVGYRASAQGLKLLALNCSKFGVQVVSAFAFSTENWARPKEDVEFVMNFFEEFLRSDMEELVQNDMLISVVGNRSRLPQSLQNQISSIEERTMSNKGMQLLIAFNYGGRYDIIRATKSIATKVKDGVLQVEDINEDLLEQHLATNGTEFPNIDLLIRAGGELRVSNFMLWQLAYSELLFVDKPFPDFDEATLIDALTAFQRRQRRYGGDKR